MRIVIVSGIFPPDVGGPASYVPRFAAWLAGRGHVVNVVCLSDRLDHDDSAYPFTVSRLPRAQFLPLRIIRTVAAIRRLLREADVLYGNNLGSESALAAILARRPTVMKVVGDYAWERARIKGWFSGTVDAYQSAAKGLRLRLLDVIRTAPLLLARRVVAPSAYLGRMIAGWSVPPSKIQVIYNAMEAGDDARRDAKAADESHGGENGTARVERKAESREPGHVVTACRLVPWKGVDGIIRALGGIAGARLTIAGDGPERDRLEALSRDLGLAERVRFAGFLSRGELRALLGRASVFALNSSYEGLPHVALEAMAAGVPVVAADAGGTGEVVLDGLTGLLVPPGDDEALRRALERVLGDVDLGRRLVDAAQARLGERFTYEAMATATERALLDVAGLGS